MQVLTTFSKSFSGTIPERVIGVWPVDLRASDTVVRTLESFLLADERERATRFSVDHARRSFVIARAALRILLARYLKSSPTLVRFRYSPNGKPSLLIDSRIRFNISHSGNLALLAFALDCEVGVDIEQIRPVCEMQTIATRYFCAEEAAELMQLPAVERQNAFFLCWTRKEAFIKATGLGLSAPLNNFRVTLRPGDSAQFLWIRGHNAPHTWMLHDLQILPGYAAALAYCAGPHHVVLSPLLRPAALLKDLSSETIHLFDSER